MTCGSADAFWGGRQIWNTDVAPLYCQKPAMPRRNPLLIVASARLAQVRQIVGDQRDLIAKLQAARKPTAEATETLQTYESSLRHLEEHERKLREEFRRKRTNYE
jgi:hypothetical protein